MNSDLIAVLIFESTVVKKTLHVCPSQIVSLNRAGWVEPQRPKSIYEKICLCVIKLVATRLQTPWLCFGHHLCRLLHTYLYELVEERIPRRV